MKFKDLKKNDVFMYNGNRYIKKSQRTAYLSRYNKTFYFGMNDEVTILCD